MSDITKHGADGAISDDLPWGCGRLLADRMRRTRGESHDRLSLEGRAERSSLKLAADATHLRR
jgi:hypothetical protein